MPSPDMPRIDERLAAVEAKMDRMDDLHTLIAALRGDMNRQFDLLRSDIDRRFEQVDRRFEQVENRFQTLDVKVDRHFSWIVGIQMALMLPVIGAMVGAYYR